MKDEKTEITVVDFNAQFGAVIPEGLDKAKVESILTRFREDVSLDADILASALSIVVTDESQTDLIRQAREMRLSFRNKRVRIENIRKDLKEQSLREGQLIDGIAKTLKEKIEPAERHLDAQEKFVEMRESERKAALQKARAEELIAVEYNPADINLGDMHLDVYAALLSTATTARTTRDQVAANAEAERIRLEQERIEREAALAAENERLQAAQEKARKDAEKKAAEQKKEREDFERKQAKAQAERERIEREAAAEREVALAEKTRLENEIARQQEDARVEKERIEAKAKAERDRIEREAEEDRIRLEVARREAAAAPDKQKLLTWLASIETAIKAVPEINDAAVHATASGIADKIAAIVDIAKDRAKGKGAAQ